MESRWGIPTSQENLFVVMVMRNGHQGAFEGSAPSQSSKGLLSFLCWGESSVHEQELSLSGDGVGLGFSFHNYLLGVT